MGETPSLTGESVGGTYRVLECTQTHTPRNQHQKGPICLWVAGEVTESGVRAQQATLFPSDPSPTYSATMQSSGLPRLDQYLRLWPLQHNRSTKTTKNGPNERTDYNSRKRVLAGVTQWIEYQPVYQSVTVLIPSQGICLSCRPGHVPSRGCVRGNYTLMFLSLSLFLPSPLSKIKTNKQTNKQK